MVHSMEAPSQPMPAGLDRRKPSPEGRRVSLHGTPSWALRIARVLRDWNLIYYRSVRVYRCDRLEDTSEGSRSDLEVVEATEADVPRLAPLQGSTAANWFARLANGHTCLVARSASGDRGYLWITCGLHYMQEVDHVVDVSQDSNGAYLHDAYVLPEARKRGIFRALMNAAKTWARARGLSTLYVSVTKDNVISRRAIESAGFAAVVGQVTLLRVGKREWKRVLRPLGTVDVLA